MHFFLLLLAICGAVLVTNAGEAENTDLTYLFATQNVYDKVVASISSAVTCTLRNPSQDQNPLAEREQVCVAMNETMLQHDEATLALQRISRFQDRTAQQLVATSAPREDLCTIDVVENLNLSFTEFVHRYRFQPVIFTLPQLSPATLKSVPWTRLDWTRPQATEASAALIRCLCNPIRGSIFHESTEDDIAEMLLPLFLEADSTDQLPVTKYCLWETSELMRHFFSGDSATGVRSPPTLTNGDVAARLKYQCRVTPSCHGAIGTTALRHLSSRVLNLSWWPLGDALGASGVWLSSADTRTALHHDLYTQFLVQVAGEKRVTLVPGAAPSCFARAWLEDGSLHASMEKFARRVQQSHCDPGVGAASSFSAFRNHFAEEDQRIWESRRNPLGGSTMDFSSCKLRPGQILWIPPRMPHDVYSESDSFSLSIRFPPAENFG